MAPESMKDEVDLNRVLDRFLCENPGDVSGRTQMRIGGLKQQGRKKEVVATQSARVG